jgi:hypothetical protein
MSNDIFEDGSDGGTTTGTATKEGAFLKGARWLRGTAYGVALWVLGFLLSVGAATLATDSRAFSEGSSLGAEGTITLAAWIFYGAHMVSVELTRNGETIASSNVATELGGAAAAMAVVVPVLLFLAGRKLGSGGWGTSAGTTMIVGYGLLTIGSWVLFTKQGAPGLGNTTTKLGPELTNLVGVMGIFYPGLAGAIGAWTAD